MKRERMRQAKRLERLYHFLGSLKPEQYNHGNYITEFKGKTPKNDCGTVACALGWATINKKEFPGLKLRFDKGCLYSEEYMEELDASDEYFGAGAYADIFDFKDELYGISKTEQLKHVRNSIKEKCNRDFNYEIKEN